MFGLGMGELLIIGFVVLIMFGGKRLPALGSSLGKAITNFKKGMNDSDSAAGPNAGTGEKNKES